MAKQNNPLDGVLDLLLKSSRKKSGNSFNNGLVVAAILFLAAYAFLTQKGCVSDFLDLSSNQETVVDSSDGGRVVPETEVCSVDRCVDGDTLVVISNGQKERIRLIGANTPETVKPNSPVEPFGPEASAYTKKRVAEFDNVVTLKKDGDSFDKYGRRLAMVYLGENGTILLNEDLIRQGLARAQTQYNYSREMKDRFSQAEEEAKRNRRNIWK